MPRPPEDAVAVVVVTHQSAADLPELVRTLIPQLRADDEVVIVDNASTDGTPEVAGALDERVVVIETGANLGFAGGCQVGSQATGAPLLLFLNPDSQPQPGCLARLRGPAAAQPEWAAWQATVLMPDGTISGSGGVVHYLGIGWAGDSGRPASVLPSGGREIPYPSGAAMVVRRAVWEELGGLDRDYFMYGEDLDLGLRLWLAGYRVGSVPSSWVIHDHQFDKGAFKWFWLERNRWRTVLSVYPAPLLVLVAPALVAADAGLVAVAAREGWLRPKLRAQLAVLRDLPHTLRRRRAVQRTRRTGAADFASHLTSSLDSPFLTGVPPLLGRAQARYWSLVLVALRLLPRRRSAREPT